MSCRTIMAEASEGVVKRSVTSFGPHCRLPPPTITIRISGSRDVPLSIEPAEQDGDASRVVAQLVTGTGDDPHLGRAVRVGDHACVEVRDEIVVSAVHDEQRPWGVL